MKRRYRRLEVGEMIQEGDRAIVKEFEHMLTTASCEAASGFTVKETDANAYFRPYDFMPIKLIRKYRLVKDNEPIRMFDWFKLSVHHEDGLWPDPNKQYNEGWCQVTPDTNGYLADNDSGDRLGFVFARFVDCVPITKS